MRDEKKNPEKKPKKTNLVDSGANTALQHHLQHLGVGRLLVCGQKQLLCFFLHVLNGHLHRDQNDLMDKKNKGKTLVTVSSGVNLRLDLLNPCSSYTSVTRFLIRRQDSHGEIPEG